VSQACNPGAACGHIPSVNASEHFEALYSEHARAVLAYTRRRCDRSEAEDVLAEVFLVAWRRLESIPPHDARVWLLGVARRVLSNKRRGTARRAALHSRLAESQPRDGGVFPDANVGDSHVLQALASLDEGDRELLLLLGWEQLDRYEAARVLEIRPGTLSVRLHRSRRRFARALAATGHPPFAIEPTNTMETQ
jgi:RNA polymerase sigma-70 factor, ECF subfamily